MLSEQPDNDCLLLLEELRARPGLYMPVCSVADTKLAGAIHGCDSLIFCSSGAAT